MTQIYLESDAIEPPGVVALHRRCRLSSSASTAAWPLTSLTLMSVAQPWSGRTARIARSRARL